MMMLLISELAKIIKNKKFILAVFSLFILSILVFELDISQSDNMQLSQTNLYKVIEIEKADQSLKELSEQIKILIQIDEAINSDLDFGIISERYSSNQLDEYLNLKTLYGDDYFKYADKIIKQMQTEASIGDYYTYNQAVLDEIQYLLGNTKKSNHHQYQYLNRLSNIYENLKTINITKSDNLSIDAYVSSNFQELIILLLVILTAYTLVNVEHESEMIDALSITKKGKKGLSKFKLLALIAFTIFFVIVNEALIVIYTSFKYGSFAWFANIQTYQSLFGSPYNMNVLQFVVYGIGFKILYGILIGSVVYTILSVFDNRVFAVLFVVLILGVSAYQFYGIPDSSVFRNLKYLNLFAFGMYFKLIKSFIFLNFGFISFSWMLSTLVLLISLSIVFLLLGNFLYIKYNAAITFPNLRKHQTKKLFETVMLMWHEGFKFFIMEGNILVLVLFISLFSSLGYQIVNEEISSYSQSINEYIDSHGGLIDDDFNHHFENEIQFYNQVKSNHAKMLSDYNQGEIGEAEFQIYLSEFSSVNYSMNVFESVHNRINFEHDYFINTSGYNRITSQYNYKNDNRIALLIMITLIVIISNAFSLDHRNFEASVYDLSHKGFKGRSTYKIINAIILSTVLVLVSSVIFYLLIKFKFGLNYNHIPLSNIIDLEVNSIGFKNHPNLLQLSINQYFLLVMLTRLVGVAFVGLSSLFVAYKIKDRSIILVVLTFIFILPSILLLLGFEVFRHISVFDLISGNLYYRNTGGFLKLVLVFILLVILSGYFIYVSYKNKPKSHIYY